MEWIGQVTYSELYTYWVYDGGIEGLWWTFCRFACHRWSVVCMGGGGRVEPPWNCGMNGVNDG